MLLTEHFALEEFTRSETAERLGIDNTPSEAVVEHLRRLCVLVLEPLRQRFGKPIRINSGYRCPALNRAVGGVRNSRHLTGDAADIPMKPGYLAYIRDHLPHRELINEGTWIHVSI